jgi:4-aminobutyrate aminotransferase
MTALDLELTANWLARDTVAMAPTLSRYFDIVAASGEGSWLIDTDGRRWLDLTSGIAVTNTGHCHPRVVAAIVEQASQLLHTSVVTHHQRNVELAERIGRLTPWFTEPQVFFCNSGAEAVDGSLKLARRVTGRPGIIAFRGAFHGRTFGGTSLTTSKAKYREGYEPLLSSVAIAPYGRGDAAAALAGLDEILATQMAGANVGAMVVEPVLGEGGYIVPPVAWLEGLRERCDTIGALLIFDEVQCGMGRTGRPFAAETFGVRPDVLLFAKGVASGMPLGGIVAERATFAQWPPASHGSTFGGNPVSCAAALATIDVLEEGGLWARAGVVGHQMLSQLREATRGNRAVVEVRGIGLMIGIELVSGEVAAEVQRRCFDAGALLLVCGTDDRVIRLIPPLTISDDEAARGIEILTAALGEVAP